MLFQKEISKFPTVSTVDTWTAFLMQATKVYLFGALEISETVEIDHSLEDHQELLKRTDLISEEVPTDSDSSTKQVVRMHIVP